jgi:hypothetical protein
MLQPQSDMEAFIRAHGTGNVPPPRLTFQSLTSVGLNGAINPTTNISAPTKFNTLSRLESTGNLDMDRRDSFVEPEEPSGGRRFSMFGGTMNLRKSLAISTSTGHRPSLPSLWGKDQGANQSVSSPRSSTSGASSASGAPTDTPTSPRAAGEPRAGPGGLVGGAFDAAIPETDRDESSELSQSAPCSRSSLLAIAASALSTASTMSPSESSGSSSTTAGNASGQATSTPMMVSTPSTPTETSSPVASPRKSIIQTEAVSLHPKGRLESRNPLPTEFVTDVIMIKRVLSPEGVHRSASTPEEPSAWKGGWTLHCRPHWEGRVPVLSGRGALSREATFLSSRILMQVEFL